MKKLYRYHVVYIAKDGLDMTVGSRSVILNGLLDSQDIHDEIRDAIKEDYEFDSITILNWKLISTEIVGPGELIDPDYMGVK